MKKDQNKKKIPFSKWKSGTYCKVEFDLTKDKGKKEFADKMKSEIIKRGNINKEWANKHLIVMM